MGRPVTELITLEPFQRQMFVLLRVLNWTLPEVTDFFDLLFEEMSKLTGFRLRVPNKQWQGRKEKWDKMWNIERGRTIDEVLGELADLPIWYNGKVDVISFPPGSNGNPTQSTVAYHWFTPNLKKDQRELMRIKVPSAQSGSTSVKRPYIAPLTGSYPHRPMQLSTPQAYQEDALLNPCSDTLIDQHHITMPDEIIGSPETAHTEPATPQVPSTRAAFPMLHEDNKPPIVPSGNANLTTRPRSRQL